MGAEIELLGDDFALAEGGGALSFGEESLTEAEGRVRLAEASGRLRAGLADHLVVEVLEVLPVVDRHLLGQVVVAAVHFALGQYSYLLLSSSSTAVGRNHVRKWFLASLGSKQGLRSCFSSSRSALGPEI